MTLLNVISLLVFACVATACAIVARRLLRRVRDADGFEGLYEPDSVAADPGQDDPLGTLGE
ncbi:MAG: hypothetical protein WAY93_03920 [Atopobiaceae bacterium]|jgi:hypothetical protein|nr:hypothetical protein [Atopobiaceae bacterium]